MKKKIKIENFIMAAIVLLVALGLLGISFISPRKYYPYAGDSNLQIVVMGDSNMAYHFEGKSIPTLLNEKEGYTAFDVALGGTAAAKLNVIGNPERGEDLFGFYNLTKIAVTQDYQPVIALENEKNGEMIGKIACLTDIDLKQVDYIIISYGLNDYLTGTPVANENPHDESTYAGALRNGIQALQSVTDATIIISSITYATYIDEAGTVYDGYEKDFGGGTIDLYRDAAKEVASEFENVIFLDALEEMGIRFANHEQYLGDIIHFNQAGRERYLECLMRVLEEEKGSEG